MGYPSRARKEAVTCENANPYASAPFRLPPVHAPALVAFTLQDRGSEDPCHETRKSKVDDALADGYGSSSDDDSVGLLMWSACSATRR